MRIGEVCLITNDVPRLARFYRQLLHLDGDCDDPIHQTLLACETMLTVYNDGAAQNPHGQNVCLAFSVTDVDAEFQRLQLLGVPILEPPTTRPWGARNLCLADPDGNRVYLRCRPATEGCPSA